MTLIESIAILSNLLIIGGIGGFLAGYTIKRIAKIFVVGLGILFFILMLMAQLGILRVNYEKPFELWSSLIAGQVSELLVAAFGYLPLVSSFAIGFTIGMKG